MWHKRHTCVDESVELDMSSCHAKSFLSEPILLSFFATCSPFHRAIVIFLDGREEIWVITTDRMCAKSVVEKLNQPTYQQILPDLATVMCSTHWGVTILKTFNVTISCIGIISASGIDHWMNHSQLLYVFTALEAGPLAMRIPNVTGHFGIRVSCWAAKSASNEFGCRLRLMPFLENDFLTQPSPSCSHTNLVIGKYLQGWSQRKRCLVVLVDCFHTALLFFP